MTTNVESAGSPNAGDAPVPDMTPREIRQALTGLMTGMFVAILAATVVSNALPVIIADLGGSQSAYTWVVTAELLAMTAGVPLWGELSDLYSQKLLIQLALAFFVAGSVLSGLAQDAGTLIVARIFQGIGAGGVTALVQVVMAAMIPPRELGRYAGVFGGVFAAATVSGPLVGGLLVDTSWLGWRATFLLGVPFAVLAIVLLQKTLRLHQAHRAGRVDWLGALLITSGICTLLIWVTLAGDRFAWSSGVSLLMAGGAATLLILAGWVESRAAEPLFPLPVLANRTVALTAVASALVGMAMYGSTVFLSQYFQISLNYSPTVSGLLSLPMILGLLMSSTIAGGLISRSGRWKRFLVAGGVLLTTGFGLLSTIDAMTSVFTLSAFLVVVGIGIGLLMQNLVLAAQNDVPASHVGAATSTLTFSRTLGGTIGVSLLGALLASQVTGDLDGSSVGSAGGHDLAVPDVSALPPDLLGLVQQAYADATAELFLVATPLAALALSAVVWVKEIPLKKTSAAQRLAREQESAPNPS